MTTAAPAVSEDRSPVCVRTIEPLPLAGVPWRDGYCTFFLPRSPVWGWYPVGAVYG